MKKKVLSIATITLASSLLFSSCIGSFGLSNKLLAWNQTIDNKFVNELVFICLTPVYAITLTVDGLVLNSIEFWTGKNPMEAGIVKTVQGENGTYTVETLENGYDIKDPKGAHAQFIYNKDENTWSFVENNKSTKLVKIEDKDHATAYLPNGKTQEVTLSADGMLALRQTVDNAYNLAQR